MERIDPLPFDTTRTIRVIKPIQEGSDKERKQKREARQSDLIKKQSETQRDSSLENSNDETAGKESEEIGRRIDIQV